MKYLIPVLLLLSTSLSAQNRFSAGLLSGVSSPMNEVEFVTPGHPGFTANSSGLAVVVSFEVEYSLKDRVAFFGGFRPSTEIRTGFNWTSDPEGRAGQARLSVEAP